MEYILNNQVYEGELASLLVQNNFDVGAMRPFLGADGRSYVSIFNADTGQRETVLARNSNAVLTKDAWKEIDRNVREAAMTRLRAVQDLRTRGLVERLPNGMGTTIFESQLESDISDAQLVMDPVQDTPRDRPEYSTVGIPLPVIAKDFSFSAREIASSKRWGRGLDMTMARKASRKVAELAEKILIGSTTSDISFGGYSINGYLTSNNTISETITSPEASGWTAETTVSEIIDMVQASVEAKHSGPWVLYYGNAWIKYFGDDYKDSQSETLADRIRRIDGIDDVRHLEELTGYSLVLVQMDKENVRLIEGMDITSIQWQEKGGMKLCWKVMAIMVPDIRTDFAGNSGIVIGSVA